MKAMGEPFTAIFEVGGEELWRGRVTSVEQCGQESTVTVVAPVTDPPGKAFRPTGDRQYVIEGDDFDHMILTAMRESE